MGPGVCTPVKPLVRMSTVPFPAHVDNGHDKLHAACSTNQRTFARLWANRRQKCPTSTFLVHAHPVYSHSPLLHVCRPRRIPLVFGVYEVLHRSWFTVSHGLARTTLSDILGESLYQGLSPMLSGNQPFVLHRVVSSGMRRGEAHTLRRPRSGSSRTPDRTARRCPFLAMDSAKHRKWLLEAVVEDAHCALVEIDPPVRTRHRQHARHSQKTMDAHELFVPLHDKESKPVSGPQWMVDVIQSEPIAPYFQPFPRLSAICPASQRRPA